MLHSRREATKKAKRQTSGTVRADYEHRAPHLASSNSSPATSPELQHPGLDSPLLRHNEPDERISPERVNTNLSHTRQQCRLSPAKSGPLLSPVILLTLTEKGMETPFPNCTHLTAVREMMDKIICPLRVKDPG
jgi:hypothetical protein